MMDWRQPRPLWTPCWRDSRREVTAPLSPHCVSFGPNRRVSPVLPHQPAFDSFRHLALNRNAGGPNFPMQTFYADLAAALEERLAVIADQTLRTEQPERQIQKLQAVSARIEALKAQL